MGCMSDMVSLSAAEFNGGKQAHGGGGGSGDRVVVHRTGAPAEASIMRVPESN
jgi:hypothetical protein